MTVDYVSQYTVRPGDTLTKISQATGVPVQSLMQANGIDKPETLKAGQDVLIVGDSAFGLSQADIFKSGVKAGHDPQEPDIPSATLPQPSAT